MIITQAFQEGTELQNLMKQKISLHLNPIFQ